MDKTFVNVTLPLIHAEVNQVLETDLYCLQSELSAIPHIRQEIVSYALRRIRCRYRLIDEKNGNSYPSSLSLEEAIEVETIVRQGIQQIIYRTRIETISPLSPDRSSALLPLIQALTPQL
jgi:hypothetical protein